MELVTEFMHVGMIRYDGFVEVDKGRNKIIMSSCRIGNSVMDRVFGLR